MNNSLLIAKEYGITPYFSQQPIYKYRTIKQAKEMLQRKKLWFAKGDSLNDVFEFNTELLDFNASLTAWRQYMYETDIVKNLKGDKKYRWKFVKQFTKQQMVDAYIEILEIRKSKIGVFSCSKKNNDPLMWSHYGEANKGVCFGLRIPPLIENEIYLLFNVNYVDTPKKIKITSSKYGRDFPILYWLFTKHIRWQYEDEVRAILFEKNGEAHFDETNLTEIYFGTHTDSHDKQEILELIQKNNFTQIDKIGTMSKGRGYNLEII